MSAPPVQIYSALERAQRRARAFPEGGCFYHFKWRRGVAIEELSQGHASWTLSSHRVVGSRKGSHAAAHGHRPWERADRACCALFK
jgi:hypothetical protein